VSQPLAAGYTRVSTLAQARSGLGLEAQVSAIERYASAKGLELVEVFSDPAVSGGKPLAKRQGGLRLRESLVTRRTTHVVIPRLDRAFRSVTDALRTSDEWRALGVTVHLLDLGLVIGPAAGGVEAVASKLILSVMACVAELERVLASERTRAAAQRCIESGRAWGRVQAYGWRRAGSRRVEDPAEQAVLAEMLALRQEGLTYRAVAGRLDTACMPNRAGNAWDAASVRRICLRHLDLQRGPPS